VLDQAYERRRRRVSEQRSYALAIVVLNIYAAVAAVIVLRTVLVGLGATESIWMGRFIQGLLGRVTDAMAVLPGASREIIGPFTMVDISLLGLVLLFPLGVVASGGTIRRRIG
jgi:hypothetical protein